MVTEWPARRFPKTCRSEHQPLKPAAAVNVETADGDVAVVVVVARIAGNADAADFLSN